MNIDFKKFKVYDTLDKTTPIILDISKELANGLYKTAQANKYVLPTATAGTIGGVKVGANISYSNGTISLSKANVTSALGYTPPTADTKVTINNTLTSTSTTEALAAAQGKALKGLIDALTARVAALEAPAA